MRLKDLAAVRVHYGYRRLCVLLRREGWAVNHKRVHRLYAEAGLLIRTKRPQPKRAWRIRQGRAEVGAANEVWSLAYPLRGCAVADQMFDGRRFRILTILDIHTREALSAAPGANFRAAQVDEVLDQLARNRCKPTCLRVDHGPEFAGRLLDHWATLNKVEIDFSRPGPPTDNAFVEVPVAGGRPEPDRGVEGPLQRGTRHSALGNLTPQASANKAPPARKVA